MVKRRASLLLSLVVLWLGLGDAVAQERELLFSKSLSPKLQESVGIIRNPRSEKIDEAKLTWTTDTFVRIAPRRNILTPANQLLDSANQGQNDAILGTRPYVFVTSPESIYGRSLLEIYEDIGYEAEDIIRWQRNQDMVAIVFRYPAEITLAQEIKDGRLPAEWDKRVYVPHWDNLFSLFYRLAERAVIEPGQKGEFAPAKTFFRSEAEKSFALTYGEGARARIKKLSYAEIKAVGGADWVYRKLLEDKLSAFEHFRGTGRTQNEVLEPNGEAPGLVEFVGPNRKIKDLPEVAIVHLGQLTIADPYSKDN
ncbi:MAG: hypothetical protein M3347_01780 [Armatimonadota bacterium]|nr:hypothetical protein [Armatimonadota bacterium]